MFELIKEFYEMGLYTEEMLQTFVNIGVITEEEMNEIIGKDKKGV